MADAPEEEKLTVPSDLKQPIVSETKMEIPDDPIPKMDDPSKDPADGGADAEGKADAAKEPKVGGKEGGKEGDGAAPPPGGAAGTDADDWRIKNVKAKKNQFAINRLLLMFMDIKPEELTQETVDDLKKIYCLLVHIHSVYTTLPP